MQRGNIEPKVLVLIIASDGNEAYKELQKIWKAYMHADPQHFEVYFIRGNPDLTIPYEIKGDDLYVKCVESLVPGIVDKTVLSMEAMLPRLKEFDYVLRTNLSSFYVFPRLLNLVKTLPKEKCYCGVTMHLTDCPLYRVVNFVSGAGILLSRDLVEMLVLEKESIFKMHADLPDDVLLGLFFQRNGIRMLDVPRIDYITRAQWIESKHAIPDHAFHFRAKRTFSLRSPEDQFEDELFIDRELLKMIYTVSLD